MDDVAIIREILAVTHVPVVAQLQWEKLQGLLRSVCDRLAAHTARLEKTEELVKNFQSFKQEIYELCRNTAKECKEFTEIEVQKQAEKLENHMQSTADRLSSVQKGMEQNAARIKQTTSDLEEVKGVIGPLPKRVDGLEEGTKALNAVTTQLQDRVKEQEVALLKQGEQFQAQFDQHVTETTGAVRVMAEEIESLQADVLDHSARLQELEAQTSDVKTQLQQTASKQASELEALQKYCQGLRQDLDTKLVAPEVKPGQRRPSAIMADLGSAVTDLQSRLGAKADTSALDQITQSNRDAIERIATVVDDLRHQVRRGSTSGPPSRRSSKLSSLLASGGTKGMVTDYVADEVREALKSHDKLLDEIHRDMGYLGKGMLILSGHDRNLVREFLPEELPSKPQSEPPSDSKVAGSQSLAEPLPEPTYEDMFFSFEKALREKQIQPKEDCAQIRQLQGTVSSLTDSKADKKDMQRIARIVREFMEQPEHAVFTGKPLMGFKCMSCDQDIAKLNPMRVDYLAHDAMPKQRASMMSAERIYAPNGETPRTPRLSGRLSNRNNPYSSRLPRRSISAGNPSNLCKPL